MLADVKRRNDEYKAQRAAGNVAPAATAQPSAPVATGGFTF